MKTKKQLSTLLGVCIIPHVIAEIKNIYNDQEKIAIKEFYKSNLFDKLQNPDTGLWHIESPENFVQEIDNYTSAAQTPV